MKYLKINLDLEKLKSNKVKIKLKPLLLSYTLIFCSYFLKIPLHIKLSVFLLIKHCLDKQNNNKKLFITCCEIN